MSEFSPQELIEFFNITFLRFLGRALPKNAYALKGDCNLRFFFQSVRYSQDMDFDAFEIGSAFLEERVNKLLAAKDLRQALESLEVELINPRPHKQTESTQRWKLSLQSKGLAVTLPTKIEFSRRNKPGLRRCVFEAVDQALLRHYRSYPVLVMHYDASAAIEQKV